MHYSQQVDECHEFRTAKCPMPEFVGSKAEIRFSCSVPFEHLYYSQSPFLEALLENKSRYATVHEGSRRTNYRSDLHLALEQAREELEVPMMVFPPPPLALDWRAPTRSFLCDGTDPFGKELDSRTIFVFIP